jgi:hypothetical protein
VCKKNVPRPGCESIISIDRLLDFNVERSCFSATNSENIPAQQTVNNANISKPALNQIPAEEKEKGKEIACRSNRGWCATTYRRLTVGQST